MWSISLLCISLGFVLQKSSLAQDVMGLPTQGVALRPTEQFSVAPSASLNPQNLQSAISVDNTSVVIVGENGNLQLENGAKVDLHVQSGFRVLARSTVSLGLNSLISAIESSHLAITRRMILGPDVMVTLTAGRIFDYETLILQDSAKLALQDGSRLSVFEGGSVIVGRKTKLDLYRGSTLTVSESWVYARMDVDPKSMLTFGPTNQVTLVDMAKVHVAGDGRLSTGEGVTVDLKSQSSLVVVGRLNITDQSRVTIGARAQLVVGLPNTDSDFTERLARNVTSSLIFSGPNLSLTLRQGVTFRVTPNAHCLLTASNDITSDVELTSNTADKPFALCFATYDNLIAAQMNPRLRF